MRVRPEQLDPRGPTSLLSTMTVLPFPVDVGPRGRWAWDARGYDRAARVSAHPDQGVINLSLWRDDVCVGTVRLLPGEVAGLVEGLTDGLAQLAVQPAPAHSATSAADEQLRVLEERIARLEGRPRSRDWRAAVTEVAGRARGVLADRLPCRTA